MMSLTSERTMEMDSNDFEDDDIFNAMEILDTLNNLSPQRQKQINLLYNFFGADGDPVPSSIYLYGDAATGKTKVVTDVLELSSACYALVNCVECYTVRLLLEPLLDKLLGVEYSKEPGAERCDNLMVFVKQLRIAAHNGVFDNKRCVIVLENCERLFDLGEHYFLAFQKLQEITDLNSLCVVFTSQILPEKFSCSVPHIRIFFPQYTKDDVSKILFSIKDDFLDTQDEENLFKQFLKIFLDIFYLATRDLNELKHQMVAVYPKYVEPVRAGRIKPNDTHALYKHIAPHIRASLSNVYLPGTDTNEERNTKIEAAISSKIIQSLDLPYYAKYFLVAAFLASYNSPKDDKRLFVKNHGKKKKRLVQDQKKENACKELLGPKTFTLDRLLAIFYAIMEEKTPLNANLMAQISTLVELRLLMKLGDDLDRPKYKCAVGIDTVEAVSRTLDFNIRKYMVN